MKKLHFFCYFPFFLLFSVLLGAFYLLLNQVPSYSIRNHAFNPSLQPLLLLSMLFFLLLLGIWLFYSKITTNFYSLGYSESLSRDFLSYVPLIFLLLAPFSFAHYLSREDILTRLKLFILAVLSSLLYLKIANLYLLEKIKPSFFSRVREWFFSLSKKKKLILLFAAALVLYNAGSALLISEGITFSGDEPHYLIISHSLLEDGDLDLSNNYANKDYTKYMNLAPGAEIEPHFAPGTGRKYSFHSPGVSFLTLPFYALGSVFGKKFIVFFVCLGMSIFGALLGIQIFLYASQEWKREKLALTLWFLFSFTSPVFFYSIHVYPEIIIALFSLTLFRLLRFSKSFSGFSLLLSGLLLSSFIWFHALKYIFLLVPLAIYSLYILIKKHGIRWRLLYFFSFPVLLTSVYFFFQYNLYDSFSLSSISWRGALTAQESLVYIKSILSEIPFRYRYETLAGYFFDQKDGLLLYAPIYFFSFLGMAVLLRRKRKEFFLLLFLTLPYVLNSAFLTQRTGYAPQARPLVAICWVMAIFLGNFLAHNAKKIFSILLAVFSFISYLFVYLLIRNPLALYQLTTLGEKERAGELFMFLSNLHFFLPRYLPSYIKTAESSWLPNFVWIAILILFVGSYIVIKKHAFRIKYQLHLAFASLGIIVFFLWIVLFPRMVLLYPRKTHFPSGEKITFFALGRVARMIEPGKFHLPEDNRPYVFYFTSWREIKKFQLNFGSLQGTYSVKIDLFDLELFQGKTEKEIRTLYIPSPPSYRLKKTNLYRISIYLENRSEVSTAENPFIFSIYPFSQTS